MRATALAVLLLAPLAGCTPANANAPTAQAAKLDVPASSSAWSFAILGDSRDDPDSVFPTIVQQIHADGNLAFVLHLGDMVRSGGGSQLSKFLKTSAPIRECFFPVIGNHEIRRDKDRHDFKAAFSLKSTSYSFTYRNAHIAVVDNASQEFSDGVLKWLRADLEAHKKGTEGIKRVFVAMHIPPEGYGVATHVEGDKASKFYAGSKSLLELLRAYSVDAILAGHVHRAQIVDLPGNPRLVISGAAGAPQGWTRSPVYGYHRVTVSGPETRIDFVKVKPDMQAHTENARVHQSGCPKIDNAYGG